MTGADGTHARCRVVGAIGLAQILAWGGSYYLISVLARPIAAGTGWGLGWVVGGLSIGFLATGVMSPIVGRWIERWGGRPVLCGSAVVLAVGLAGLAWSPGIVAYLLAWLVMGVGMAMGLYDPAFSTLGRIYGEKARGAITQVTLLGGFASTVCWPLSAALVERLGWRGACLAYAAVMLAVVLPLYAFGVPREAAVPPKPATAGVIAPDRRAAFWWLAGNLTLASVLMTVVSIHMLTLLQARGLSLATSVALGALIGPAQVAARVVEMLFAGKRHPVWTLIASTVLAMAGLSLVFGAPAMAGAGLVLYGSGAGIRSIARGTVPLAIFGREGYARMMGAIALPIMLAQAAAPSLGAVLLERLGPGGTLVVLAGAAALNVATALPLLRWARPARA